MDVVAARQHRHHARWGYCRYGHRAATDVAIELTGSSRPDPTRGSRRIIRLAKGTYRTSRQNLTCAAGYSVSTIVDSMNAQTLGCLHPRCVR